MFTPISPPVLVFTSPRCFSARGARRHSLARPLLFSNMASETRAPTRNLSRVRIPSSKALDIAADALLPKAPAAKGKAPKGKAPSRKSTRNKEPSPPPPPAPKKGKSRTTRSGKSILVEEPEPEVEKAVDEDEMTAEGGGEEEPDLTLCTSFALVLTCLSC